MVAATGQAPIPQAVAQRALEWLVDLQSTPRPPKALEHFQRWRTQHPDHERAWQRIEAFNGQLQDLSSPVHSAITHATLTRPATPKRRQAVKTLAVLIFAGSAGWVAQEQTPWRRWSADYRTAVGERRSVVLADGTQMILNTNSAVNLHFDAERRLVELIAGEILVTTAKDQQNTARPFLVQTRHGRARALGTRFSVQQLGDASCVKVLHSAVEIAPVSGAPTLILHAGQQASFTASSILPVLPVLEGSTAWTDGFIVALGLRLDDFLADVGRYCSYALSCDPAVAGRRVSGSYALADIDTLLDTVSVMLHLEQEIVSRFWGRQVTGIRLRPRTSIS
ncbi:MULTISPECIES: FecR domain-containing protein [unclassified Janthinobacterium]|uniref:FecR domain-containing protein n=1 Tax=unclassified Janthinobacterium TaxID=2610881 RepID=UPI001615EF23|nr:MULTISPECIES: FecR family protein [unclassified Janthinobacterium]MBB5610730.1 transmembrane sensor [Janthinobacterium sp. S3T4]MBB5616216.1 transmembrane sensor [Janthinobacterium sp. S3M3]